MAIDNYSIEWEQALLAERWAYDRTNAIRKQKVVEDIKGIIGKRVIIKYLYATKESMIRQWGTFEGIVHGCGDVYAFGVDAEDKRYNIPFMIIADIDTMIEIQRPRAVRAIFEE